MDTMTISMAMFETALGRCGVRWSDAGITGVLLPGSRSLAGPAQEAGADVPAFVRRAIDGMTAVIAMLVMAAGAVGLAAPSFGLPEARRQARGVGPVADRARAANANPATRRVAPPVW